MNAVAINELKVEYNILCLTSLVRNIQICFRSQNTVILFEMNSLYNRMAPGMRVTVSDSKRDFSRRKNDS